MLPWTYDYCFNNYENNASQFYVVKFTGKNFVESCKLQNCRIFEKFCRMFCRIFRKKGKESKGKKRLRKERILAMH